MTALHFAIKLRRSKVAELLTGNRVTNASVTDPPGTDPAPHCQHGQPEEGGCAAHVDSANASVEARDTHLRTPVWYAACHDRTPQMIQLLADRGADVNAPQTWRARPRSIRLCAAGMQERHRPAVAT